MSIAEQDRLQFEKVVDELTQLRSREAMSAALEVAYAMGRRTGFGEAGDLAREMLAPTERPSLSETEVQK